MGRSKSADRLAELCDRAPIMETACRSNRRAEAIEADVEQWAVQSGLNKDRARFGWFAAHAFSEASLADAALFGKWFTWYFHLDDLFDDGAARDQPAQVAEICEELMAPLFAGYPGSRTESVVLERLWEETAPRMGPGWQSRFIDHVRTYVDGLINESTNRAASRIPGEAEYLSVRRKTNGPFLFDLMEVILRTEVPPGIFETPVWQVLFDGSSDITAWCNDIASLDRDVSNQDGHNYILVIARSRDLSVDAAAQWVADRIVQRCQEIQEAASTVPRVCADHGMDHSKSAYICRVACAIVALPRAHLDWLYASARYGLPARRR